MEPLQNNTINSSSLDYTLPKGIQDLKAAGMPVPTAILLHEYGSTPKSMDLFTDRFRRLGMEVVPYALLGHGGRGGNPNNFVAMLMDLQNYIAALNQSQPNKIIIVIGHGLGGALAINLAKNPAVAQVIAIAAFYETMSLRPSKMQILLTREEWTEDWARFNVPIAIRGILFTREERHKVTLLQGGKDAITNPRHFYDLAEHLGRKVSRDEDDEHRYEAIIFPELGHQITPTDLVFSFIDGKVDLRPAVAPVSPYANFKAELGQFIQKHPAATATAVLAFFADMTAKALNAEYDKNTHTFEMPTSPLWGFLHNTFANDEYFISIWRRWAKGRSSRSHGYARPYYPMVMLLDSYRPYTPSKIALRDFAQALKKASYEPDAASVSMKDFLRHPQWKTRFGFVLPEADLEAFIVTVRPASNVELVLEKNYRECKGKYPPEFMKDNPAAGRLISHYTEFHKVKIGRDWDRIKFVFEEVPLGDLTVAAAYQKVFRPRSVDVMEPQSVLVIRCPTPRQEQFVLNERDLAQLNKINGMYNIYFSKFPACPPAEFVPAIRNFMDAIRKVKKSSMSLQAFFQRDDVREWFHITDPNKDLYIDVYDAMAFRLYGRLTASEIPVCEFMAFFNHPDIAFHIYDPYWQPLPFTVSTEIRTQKTAAGNIFEAPPTERIIGKEHPMAGVWEEARNRRFAIQEQGLLPPGFDFNAIQNQIPYEISEDLLKQICAPKDIALADSYERLYQLLKLYGEKKAESRVSFKVAPLLKEISPLVWVMMSVKDTENTAGIYLDTALPSLGPSEFIKSWIDTYLDTMNQMFSYIIHKTFFELDTDEMSKSAKKNLTESLKGWARTLYFAAESELSSKPFSHLMGNVKSVAPVWFYGGYSEIEFDRAAVKDFSSQLGKNLEEYINEKLENFQTTLFTVIDGILSGSLRAVHDRLKYPLPATTALNSDLTDSYISGHKTHFFTTIMANHDWDEKVGSNDAQSKLGSILNDEFANFIRACNSELTVAASPKNKVFKNFIEACISALQYIPKPKAGTPLQYVHWSAMGSYFHNIVEGNADLCEKSKAATDADKSLLNLKKVINDELTIRGSGYWASVAAIKYNKNFYLKDHVSHIDRLSFDPGDIERHQKYFYGRRFTYLKQIESLLHDLMAKLIRHADTFNDLPISIFGSFNSSEIIQNIASYIQNIKKSYRELLKTSFSINQIREINENHIIDILQPCEILKRHPKSEIQHQFRTILNQLHNLTDLSKPARLAKLGFTTSLSVPNLPGTIDLQIMKRINRIIRLEKRVGLYLNKIFHIKNKIKTKTLRMKDKINTKFSLKPQKLAEWHKFLIRPFSDQKNTPFAPLSHRVDASWSPTNEYLLIHNIAEIPHTLTKTKEKKYSSLNCFDLGTTPSQLNFLCNRLVKIGNIGSLRTTISELKLTIESVDHKENWQRVLQQMPVEALESDKAYQGRVRLFKQVKSLFIANFDQWRLAIKSMKDINRIQKSLWAEIRQRGVESEEEDEEEDVAVDEADGDASDEEVLSFKQIRKLISRKSGEKASPFQIFMKKLCFIHQLKTAEDLSDFKINAATYPPPIIKKTIISSASVKWVFFWGYYDKDDRLVRVYVGTVFSCPSTINKDDKTSEVDFYILVSDLNKSPDNKHTFFKNLDLAFRTLPSHKKMGAQEGVESEFGFKMRAFVNTDVYDDGATRHEIYRQFLTDLAKNWEEYSGRTAYIPPTTDIVSDQTLATWIQDFTYYVTANQKAEDDKKDTHITERLTNIEKFVAKSQEHNGDFQQQVQALLRDYASIDLSDKIATSFWGKRNARLFQNNSFLIDSYEKFIKNIKNTFATTEFIRNDYADPKTRAEIDFLLGNEKGFLNPIICSNISTNLNSAFTDWGDLEKLLAYSEYHLEHDNILNYQDQIRNTQKFFRKSKRLIRKCAEWGLIQLYDSEKNNIANFLEEFTENKSKKQIIASIHFTCTLNREHQLIKYLIENHYLWNTLIDFYDFYLQRENLITVTGYPFGLLCLWLFFMWLLLFRDIIESGLAQFAKPPVPIQKKDILQRINFIFASVSQITPKFAGSTMTPSESVRDAFLFRPELIFKNIIHTFYSNPAETAKGEKNTSIKWIRNISPLGKPDIVIHPSGKVLLLMSHRSFQASLLGQPFGTAITDLRMGFDQGVHSLVKADAIILKKEDKIPSVRGRREEGHYEKRLPTETATFIMTNHEACVNHQQQTINRKNKENRKIAARAQSKLKTQLAAGRFDWLATSAHAEACHSLTKARNRSLAHLGSRRCVQAVQKVGQEIATDDNPMRFLGLTIENLTGFQARGSGDTVAETNHWTRGMMSQFMQEKAKIERMQCNVVPPHYTSTLCAKCGCEVVKGRFYLVKYDQSNNITSAELLEPTSTVYTKKIADLEPTRLLIKDVHKKQYIELTKPGDIPALLFAVSSRSQKAEIDAETDDMTENMNIDEEGRPSRSEIWVRRKIGKCVLHIGSHLMNSEPPYKNGVQIAEIWSEPSNFPYTPFSSLTDSSYKIFFISQGAGRSVFCPKCATSGQNESPFADRDGNAGLVLADYRSMDKNLDILNLAIDRLKRNHKPKRSRKTFYKKWFRTIQDLSEASTYIDKVIEANKKDDDSKESVLYYDLQEKYHGKAIQFILDKIFEKFQKIVSDLSNFYTTVAGKKIMSEMFALSLAQMKDKASLEEIAPILTKILGRTRTFNDCLVRMIRATSADPLIQANFNELLTTNIRAKSQASPRNKTNLENAQNIFLSTIFQALDYYSILLKTESPSENLPKEIKTNIANREKSISTSRETLSRLQEAYDDILKENKWNRDSIGSILTAINSAKMSYQDQFLQILQESIEEFEISAPTQPHPHRPPAP